jgi:C-terminal processing protease CtpA/Prc
LAQKKPSAKSNNTVQALPLSPQEQAITNLRAFAKLYGYVRYFHPSDEAVKIDWDKFAIYGAGKVKNARTTDELALTLEELLLPIAPTLQILRPNEKPRPVDIPEHSGTVQSVAWQHKGLGVGVYNLYGDDSPYRSLRLNRKNTANDGRSSFGGVRTFIGKTSASTSNPVLLLRGKEIKFTAAVRADVYGSEDGGRLWLRVDTDNGFGGFFDNMAGSHSIQSSEWGTYTIVGRVDSNAVDITVGCALGGRGKLWVDDMRLFTRANANETWKPVPIPNGGFEKFETMSNGRQAYKDWEGGSREHMITPSKDKPKEGDYCVLIQYLSPKESDAKKELFAAKPKDGETITKDLAGELRCVLPIALYANNTNTLGSTPKSMAAFENLQRILSKDIQGKAEQLEQEPTRLANVVVAWNVFQHFYPYFDVVRTNWDSVLTVTLAEAFRNTSAYFFVKVMRNMITALRDGHAWYHYMPNGFALNVKVENIEGQPVIIASQDSLLQRGDVIVKVDGYDTRARLAEEESLTSGTPQWKRAEAVDNIIHSMIKELPLTINRNGVVMDMTAKCKPLDKRSVFEHAALEQIGGASLNDSLNDKVWYIDLAQVSVAEIEAKANEFAQAKGIVFDMRGYPKDGNAEILGYLTDSSLLSPRYLVPQLIYPDRENVQGYDTNGRWRVQPTLPRWKGKIVFLTGGGAISQAEDIMSMVEHYKLGEIVGETTAGADGNVNILRLPGGSNIRWTGMEVLKHDGSQHHLVGIKPTVPAVRTVQGVREGRDEVLEKALSLMP